MLAHVTLTLARGPDCPYGSVDRGHEIDAPLEAGGELDPALWRKVRDFCRVRRFWLGEPNRNGRLLHRQGGFGGGTWLIDYDDRTTDDDEPGYRLGGHRFVAGEYVSIGEDDTLRIFRVANVRRSCQCIGSGFRRTWPNPQRHRGGRCRGLHHL